MYKSTTPSKIVKLKVEDFSLKSGALVASGTLFSENHQQLGVFPHMGPWSEKTIKALKSLVESIEADMATEQFGEGHASEIDSPDQDNYPGQDIIPPVREHVEYVPSPQREIDIDDF
jgi:hypothetical protein